MKTKLITFLIINFAFLIQVFAQAPHDLNIEQNADGLSLTWQWDGDPDSIRGYVIWQNMENPPCENGFAFCEGDCMGFEYIAWLGDGYCDGANSF